MLIPSYSIGSFRALVMVKEWLLTGLILLVTQIAMAFNETHLDQRCGLGEIGLSNPSTTIFLGTILYSGN